MAKRFNGEGSIRQRSNGSWEARYTNPITNKQQSVYGKTKQEVQKKLKEKLRELDELIEEEKLKQSGKLNGKNLTLNEWYDIYIERYKKNKVKPQTISMYYNQYNNWFRPTIGNKNLVDITYENIVDVLNQANKMDLASSTIKNIENNINSCLAKAVKECLIDKNIAENTYDKLMGKRKKQKRALTQEELTWFFRGLSERDPNYKFIFQLMLATGLRVNELTALRWENVSTNFDFIYIEFTTTNYYNVEKQQRVKEYCSPKNRMTRKVPIMKDLQPLFRQHKERLLERYNCNNEKFTEKDFVFQHTIKQPMTYEFIQTLIRHTQSYLEEEYNINLGHFSVHYFRHTFGTMALHSGMSIVDVQKIGGWSNPQTLLKVYAHTNEEIMTNEINKLNISLG